MKSSPAVELVTVVSLHGGWVKVAEARWEAQGGVRLLAVKARRMPTGGEEEVTGALRELAGSLPEPAREVVGLFPSGAVLTRYLTLPSLDPAELQAMAVFQLEGLLPYSTQECIVSVKVLGPLGEATRVLAVVAHRPEVERFLRICQGAGLRVTEIACSTEAVGRWHQACRPEGLPHTAGWLVAELAPEELQLAVFAGGSLLYMRQVPLVAPDAEELTARLEETIRAYEQEKIGPPVRLVTLSSSPELLGPEALERLQAALGLPVHAVDPLESSPFRESLAVAVKETAPEISFSELLGVVAVPRLLELDLLPLETRRDQARRALLRDLRRAVRLAAAGLAVVALWAGVKLGADLWALRRTQAQVQALQPEVDRVREGAERIREVSLARAAYARQMEWIGGAVRLLSGGMTLEFLELQGERALTLRGIAPDLESVTRYAADLQRDPLWEAVVLRSARQLSERSRIQFEMSLTPRKR